MLESIKRTSDAGGGPPPGQSSPSVDAVPESLAISLKSVLDRLPAALRPLVTRAPAADEKINVPTAKVLSQLATGAVRITFEELKSAAPPGMFGAGGSEEMLVDLPLPEVLRVAGPLLKRKSAQKAEPAAGSFFAGLGPSPAAVPAPAPLPAVAPLPVAPAFPVIPPVLAAPAFAPVPHSATEMPPGTATFTTFEPASGPAAPAAPAAPGGQQSNVVPVKLAVLTVSWPENIRKDAADLGDVRVEFPREELGNAMKSGKVVFTWGQLRSWMRPAVGPSAADDTALQLPLRVLVQPFMANMRTADSPKRTGFGDGTGGTTTFLNRPAPPAPDASSSPPAATAASETKLGEALGRPDKVHWTPTEIIHAVIAIPGVDGAMLSLLEGHLAAAEMQATLPPELLAYALPKLFSATGEQARQMKLGDPGVISIVAEDRHWAVFKLDKIFFTVMSRKGHLLPLPQLQTVANEVARQRK